MLLKKLKIHWESFAIKSPYFSVITDDKYKNPDVSTIESFYKSGSLSVENIMNQLKQLNINFKTDQSLYFGWGGED